jgi:hypothetical protein
LSLRAFYRDVRKSPRDGDDYKEKVAQFRLNVSPRVLLSKYAFVSLFK